MIPSDFFVEPADFSRERAAISALREEVFVAELGLDAGLAIDAVDAGSRHVLARDLQGQPIGCGRLTPQATIGRLAVRREWRRRGVGSAMLMALLDQARLLRLAEVRLHAEMSAVAFYERAGFVAEDGIVEEGGIPHRSMRRDLSTAPPLERLAPPPGAESPEIEFDGLAGCRRAMLPLLQASKRQLFIYSRALDPELFAGDDVLGEFRRIATAGRGAEIAILLQDPATALQDGAPLLSLVQRLSSSIHIREPEADGEGRFAGAYLLNDQAGLLFRPIGSRYEGSARLHAPGHHRQLLEQFRHAWDRANPASVLRQQSL